VADFAGPDEVPEMISKVGFHFGQKSSGKPENIKMKTLTESQKLLLKISDSEEDVRN
jgi:hypothetical protein